MKFPVELKNFKKVSSDAKSTTLLHPKGHKIMVAHGALDEKMKEKLHALPMHYAEGGEVQDPNEELKKSGVNININTQPTQPAQPTPSALPSAAPYVAPPPGPPPIDQAAMPAQTPVPNPTPQPVPEQPMQQAPAPAVNQELQPQQNQDPYGYGAQFEATAKGLGEQRSGIQAEQAAASKLGQEQAGIEHKFAEQTQQQLKGYQDHYNELTNERQGFMQDLQNKHIDPKHYLNSMGTGQKISTAIGLILGGIGGGLTHQENPALKFLNSQIDRDIESQKEELGKSHNLLAANMQQFGNIRDAMTMTKIMQSDIVSSQLKEAAAKATDPIAKANAMKAIGQLDMQTAPLVQQMAMRRSLMSGMQNGKADPANMIKMMAPEHEQAGLFKDLQEAQILVDKRDQLLGAFDKVVGLNTISNRLSSPLQTKKQVDALVEPLLASLSKDTAGKYTEADSTALRNLFSEILESKGSTQIKRQQLIKIASEKLHFPSLKYYGFDPGNSGRYGSGGEKKIQLGPPVQ